LVRFPAIVPKHRGPVRYPGAGVISIGVDEGEIDMDSRSAFDSLASKSGKDGRAVSRRRFRRAREKRVKKPVPPARLPTMPLIPAPSAPDPVRVAVLAIESFGRASMRASFTGTEVWVPVPDAATAAIFEAAIAETARKRSTDRLIRIVVD
jgi:hypothetical protein